MKSLLSNTFVPCLLHDLFSNLRRGISLLSCVENISFLWGNLLQILYVRSITNCNSYDFNVPLSETQCQILCPSVISSVTLVRYNNQNTLRIFFGSTSLPIELSCFFQSFVKVRSSNALWSCIDSSFEPFWVVDFIFECYPYRIK